MGPHERLVLQLTQLKERYRASEKTLEQILAGQQQQQTQLAHIDKQLTRLDEITRLRAEQGELRKEIEKLERRQSALEAGQAERKGADKWGDKIMWLPIALGTSILVSLLVALLTVWMKK
jgi:chromosome segregation ATPase